LAPLYPKPSWHCNGFLILATKAGIEEGMDQVHLKIVGRVQGVFFRANTQREASQLGLTGWVRNAADGSVEAVAQGDRKTLEGFVTWCERGPEFARVDRVDVRWETADDLPEGFHIRY